MITNKTTKMTVAEIVDNWTTMPEETLQWAGGQLLSKLCPISHATITEFQANWNPSRGFEEFSKEQQAVVKQCVDLECSDIGRFARKAAGMTEELTQDMVLRKGGDKVKSNSIRSFIAHWAVIIWRVVRGKCTRCGGTGVIRRKDMLDWQLYDCPKCLEKKERWNV